MISLYSHHFLLLLAVLSLCLLSLVESLLVAACVVVCGLSCPEACGILVSLPGVEPASAALECGFPTIGSPGDSPHTTFSILCFKQLSCVPDVRNRLCVIYLRIFCVSAQTYLLTLAHNTDCPLIQMHNDQKPSLMMVI